MSNTLCLPNLTTVNSHARIEYSKRLVSLTIQHSASSIRPATGEEKELEHLHFDFNADAGQVVQVNLNQQANVLLLDEINYMYYRRGNSFRYLGGLQKRTPACIRVPHAGHWHIAVDIAGGRGYIHASINVL
ncbi:MAG: hypothetical protein JWL77_2133 [Chthonomonadaceae bacterium]|nr:hypothetical protein [Chthonomonadaceae bacterium]